MDKNNVFWLQEDMWGRICFVLKSEAKLATKKFGYSMKVEVYFRNKQPFSVLFLAS